MLIPLFTPLFTTEWSSLINWSYIKWTANKWYMETSLKKASIHLLSSAYPRSGCRGNRFRRETQTSLSPVTLSSSSWGIPQARSWSTPGPPSSWTCPEDLQRDATRRHSNRNWLLSMWKRSSSILSSQQMAKLFTLSRRLSPAPIRRNPMLAACICSLILWVTTQISWPQVRVGTVMDQ